MHGGGAPYAWDPHLFTWVVVVAAVTSVVAGHGRLLGTSTRPIPWAPRQIRAFAGACVAAAVALTWPVADLAAHWSLTALVIQRLLLVLAVAPLLVLGLPYDVVQWLTRPAPVDATLIRLQRPPLAIVTVTGLLVGSMAPLLVEAQSRSFLARGLIDSGIVLAGFVLWIPVLGRIPGIPRLRPVVRFGYLVAQAVVPAFLSFIYIFSIRPLYSAFARSQAAIGLRPLNDQQIAGFVSKLTMLLVLLSVGGVVLARAPATDDDFGTDDQLVWADVERQFERADRQAARRRRGRGPSDAPSSATGPAQDTHPGTPIPGDPPGSDVADQRSGDPPGPEPPEPS
ncbi:MAG: cytochrome c oxidase assembly protein [Acidimicrobiales bacterium]